MGIVFKVKMSCFCVKKRYKSLKLNAILTLKVFFEGDIMKESNEVFKPLESFYMNAKYVETNYSEHKSGIDSHVHPECEIYINLSGDVSLIVENHIYPVKRGDVVIARPFEYHHCVYHSDQLHKHFWILFSYSGNEHLLDLFFKRNAGEKNLLVLSAENSEALINLCYSMLEDSDDEYKKYYYFFSLLNYLNSADRLSSTDGEYPRELLLAINYISDNYSYSISVSDIARASNVSVNTLERKFHSFFNMSPSVYLRKKRLANAVKLLSEGASVTEASEKSGFPDYSAFIAFFKKTYGITPLQYKKGLMK